ncbi:PilZ domain-containing protein [Methylomonas sp. SURF-1]|uniref:PilZ domain-containing protein n=1 Tax=Methylomonas aurea TaxID=2952224 RepID=A0ABT1UHM7_9GAMM|nr:PilZ domain-containing protein [Methylomonas sp. SURF-1]MCQ8181719.1 PilZ domain-containing protein [Methylomonas sp. SURF-1]
MSDSDSSMDFLDQEIDLDSEWSNKRSAVRYLRNDIKAAVKIHSLWFPRLFPVSLRDISSRGAAIVTDQKIKKKSRVSLFLLFSDGRRFQVEAAIVHHDAGSQRYGVKFDSLNSELAEHLLHTQTDLNFS